MNAEETRQIKTAIRRCPKSVWGYWPFLVPVIAVVAGFAVQITLLAYFKYKLPDLEILLKDGSHVGPVWDSELTREAVLTTSGSITITILLFTYLARQSFKYLGLLKTAAKDLGITGS
jgi:hypothetical protein